MKEELITFETAKLARKKGFDWECNDWWVETLEYKLDIPRSGVEHFPSHEPRILGHKPSGNYHIIHASAPTQSLLQKWLRENHNIDVSSYLIIMESNGRQLVQKLEDKEYSYRILHNGKDVFVSEVLEGKSYEQALEKGLQEGLKLI